METKKIIECLEMCAEKLGCQRYIVGNCEENVRIGNVLDEAADRLEELEAQNSLLRAEKKFQKTFYAQQPEWISVEDRLPEVLTLFEEEGEQK